MASLKIELPEEQRVALAAKAPAKGLSAEQYAREVLEHDLAPEWLRKAWETAKQAGLDQLSNEDIDAEIAAARKARHESRLQPAGSMIQAVFDTNVIVSAPLQPLGPSSQLLLMRFDRQSCFCQGPL
jgi:plasmid stability protein